MFKHRSFISDVSSIFGRPIDFYLLAPQMASNDETRDVSILMQFLTDTLNLSLGDNDQYNI